MIYEWTVTYPLPVDDPCPGGPYVSTGVCGLGATVVRDPTWYVIVGVDPLAAEALEAELEQARLRIARDMGLNPTATVPKLAAVAPDSHGADVCYRTRLAAGAGWHRKMASSGLLALGVALARSQTIPARLIVGSPSLVRVRTPAGIRTLEYAACPDGRPGVRLHGAVHLEPRGGTRLGTIHGGTQ